MSNFDCYVREGLDEETRKDWREACCKELGFHSKHGDEQYCVLHFPGEDKKDTFKEIVESKLNKNDFDFSGTVFPDGTSDFQGRIFKENVILRGAIFIGEADFSEAQFSGEKTDFSLATFEGDANFSGAIFKELAYFSEVTFKREVSFAEANFSRTTFSDATFKGEAVFFDATFEGEVSFLEATFSWANFSRATFEGEAEFSKVTFGGEAKFSNATFSWAWLNFSGSTFEGDADFSDAAFKGEVRFSDATFEEEVVFSDATVEGDAYFFRASFKKRGLFLRAAFEGGADFSGAALEGGANFDEATFEGDANFSGAIFKELAYFSEVTFKGLARFTKATFEEDADFGIEELDIPNPVETVFEGDADFSSAAFKGRANFSLASFAGHARFTEATFEKGANFTEADFAEDANFGVEEWGEVRVTSGTKFQSAANFSYVTFRGRANFYRATFEEEGRFWRLQTFPTRTVLSFKSAVIEKPERFSFHSTHLRPHWFIDVDAQKFDFSDVQWFMLPDEHGLSNGDEKELKLEKEIEALAAQGLERPGSLRKLQKACRQLMNNAEENHDYPTSNEFHYWSMVLARKEAMVLAREKRLRESLRRFGLIDALYGALSGYGDRPWRASLVLLGMLAVFAILYLVTGSIEHFGQALLYSLAAMARLTGVPAMALLTKQLEPSVPGLFRLLVTAEGILGPLQIALLALAIRRKVMR